jgi:hypothetical protein
MHPLESTSKKWDELSIKLSDKLLFAKKMDIKIGSLKLQVNHMEFKV